MDGRTVALAGLAVAAAAGVLAWASHAEDGRGRALELASGVTGRIRDLDRAARGCDGADHRAVAVRILGELRADAPPEAPLGQALGQALDCLGTWDCAACLRPALQRAEARYATALGEALRTTRDADEQRDGRLRVGVLLWLAAVAAVLGLPRRQRGEAAPRAPARDERALEDLLRRRLEELYAARLAAVQADRFAYFGEVAAGLSHGLKTPLAGIRAAATVAQAKVGPEHAAGANLADIVSEVDGLVEQVNRFLAGARTGAPALARVPLGALLEGPVREAEARAQASGRSVLREDAAPGALVEADPGLVQLALANLVDNAASSSPAGGRVTLRTARAAAPARAGLEDVAPAPSSTWVEIAVLDAGPGMPPAVAAGAVAPSSRPGGSGLGVAITRRIVARHGGALLFGPREGGGTVARVLLPESAGGAS
ncbi:MAG: HAMP domain-containing histidine kinase [Deltaproteobacteria bacterium]|nr:HAMP domain-containing histidine kinase [Deltaproteobacteria bacterium]